MNAADGASVPDAAARLDADGGSDAPVEAGADATNAWTPAKLRAADGGLVLWLEETGLIVDDAGGVTFWVDHSGKGNNVSGSSIPTRQRAAGHDVVHLGGATDALSNASAVGFAWNEGDFTVEIVAATSAPRSPNGAMQAWMSGAPNVVQERIGFNYPNTEVSAWLNDDPHLASTTTQSAGGGFNDGKLHIVGIRRSNTTTLAVRADGVESDRELTNMFSLYGTQTIIVGGGIDGEIAEIVAFNGTLDGADLDRLETYFKGKFGL